MLLKPIKILCLITCLLHGFNMQAQPPQFSAATDIGLQRSFRPDQQFWAFGHTVQAQFHVTYTDAIYFWLSYYTNGKFTNELEATAKSSSISPQQIAYTNNAQMRFQHFSVGWKKYLKGNYAIEEGWSLYAYGGFGLMFGKVTNQQSAVIDTTLYDVQVVPGIGKFKRITLDLGLGAEFPIGGGYFIYSEGRLWVPASDYPSKYVYVNDDSPVVGMFNVGVRILF